MTEVEKYRRKVGLLERALRIADELDQVDEKIGSSREPAAAERTTARRAEAGR